MPIILYSPFLNSLNAGVIISAFNSFGLTDLKYSLDARLINVFDFIFFSCLFKPSPSQADKAALNLKVLTTHIAQKERANAFAQT